MKRGFAMLRTPLCFFLLTAAVSAQTQTTTAVDPLQALLTEVHELRLALQATTVTAQRVQILLSRVQLQQGAALRAVTRADEAHAKLADAQKQHARAAGVLQQTQDAINTTTDPAHVKALEAQVAEMKRQVEMWTADEQQWMAKDAEAQSHLRNEQAKLDELQDTLDRLDRALASLAKP